MIIYEVSDPYLVIATNPKSGVQSTAHLLSALGLDFERHDLHQPIDIRLAAAHIESRALVFRDPYQRAVSMYLRFCRAIESPHEHKREPSRRILRDVGRVEQGISFREFLTYLLETPEPRRDQHYRRQHLLPAPCFVIRTERFKEDMLCWFEAVGYRSGAKALTAMTSASLRKNAAARRSGSVRPSWPDDASVVSSNLLFRERNGGFPDNGAFLNDVTRQLIADVFPGEVEFGERVRAERTGSHLQERGR